MERFDIAIDPSVIDELKRRLAHTRWTDQMDNAEWKHGTNKAFLKNLVDYWQHEFDWNRQQTYLNSFQHFKARVDRFGLHFIHHKGSGARSVPLLLIHGWPDSFVRFLKLIPLLTQASEEGLSFDVVVPSLPGHGFSDTTQEPGMNNKKMASLFASLMTDVLGYEQFLVHGGDAGSEIAEQLALHHPGPLLGMHLTDIPYHHIIAAKEDDLTREEKAYKKKVEQWQQTEGAYNMIQSTRPQTLAYGLNDSPVGLAAWIVEKFYQWSDCEGDLENCFTKDELLTNITIYWATQTIHSSFRRYSETMNDLMQEMFNPIKKFNPFDKTGTKTEVPTGIAEFRTDLLPPKDFAEQFFNIIEWNKMPRGGHFAAMEQPELLAADIREFVAKLSVGK